MTGRQGRLAGREEREEEEEDEEEKNRDACTKLWMSQKIHFATFYDDFLF